MKAARHASVAVAACVLLLVTLLRPAAAQGDAASTTVSTNASSAESSIHSLTLEPPVPLRLDVLIGYCVTAELDTIAAKVVGKEGSLILDSVPRHGALYVKYVSGGAPQLHQPLRAGRTLEYGEGTLTYCRGEAAVGEETAVMRFVPAPVSAAHPVVSLQVIFATLPSSYAPLANVTLHVDGWALLKEQAGGALSPTSVLDVSTTFSFGPDERTGKLRRKPKDGDLVRYVRHGSGPSPATLPADEQADVETVEVFAVAGPVPAWCAFYVEAGDGRPAEALRPGAAAASPGAPQERFTVPASSRLYVRVVPDAVEPQRTLGSVWNAAAEAGNDAADADTAPVVVLGFRGRRAGGAGYTTNGTVTVTWAAIPRYEVDSSGAMRLFSADSGSPLSVVAHHTGGGADPAAFAAELCITRKPYRGWIAREGDTEAAVAYPYCVACDLFEEEYCWLGGVVYMPDSAENASAVLELQERLARRKWEDPGHRAGGALSQAAPDILDVHVAVRHDAFSSAVHYPSTRTLILEQFDPVLVPNGTPVSDATSVTIEVNATSMEPVVVDVQSLLPAKYNTSRVVHYYTSFLASSHGNCAVYRVPLFRDVDDARRGVQWHQGLGYVTPYGASRVRLPFTPQYSVASSPALVRYVPVRVGSEKPPSAGAAGETSCHERVHVHVFLQSGVVTDLNLCFVLSSLLAVVDAVPELPAAQTYHTVVYEHTPNLITLPACGAGGRVGAPLLLDVVPAHGTLYRARSCTRADRQTQRLTGICGLEEADSRSGCVCCFHNCSAYLGAVLKKGETVGGLGAEMPVPGPPSKLFYNPSADDQAHEDATGDTERVVRILYHEPSKAKDGPQCALVLHIRPWVSAPVIPIGLPPTPLGAGTVEPRPSLRLLWMSARADVETGLLGFYRGSNASAVHALPLRVFECVRRASPPQRSAGGGAAMDAWLGDVYMPANKPMVPVRRHGMLGYWPAATRGCLMLEAPPSWGGNKTQPTAPAPALAVHAVLLSANSAEPLAQSTLRIQPYLVHARATASFLGWRVSTDADELRLKRNARGIVAGLRMPMFWGRGPSPAVIRFCIDAPGGGKLIAHLQMKRAARHGCTSAAGLPACLHEGQILGPLEVGGRFYHQTFQCTNNLTYTPLRSFRESARWLRPVRLLDQIEFVAINDDGERIGAPLVLDIVTSRWYHLAQYVVAAALLAGAVTMAALHWTIRERRRMLSWVRSRCSAVWMRLARLLRPVAATEPGSYEMVSGNPDEPHLPPALPDAVPPPGVGGDERP